MSERLPVDCEFWRRKKDGVTVFIVVAEPEFDPDYDPPAHEVAKGTVHLQWPDGRESFKKMPRFLAECEPCGPPGEVTQDPALAATDSTPHTPD